MSESPSVKSPSSADRSARRLEPQAAKSPHIYLDHNASTPIHARVAAAMTEAMDRAFGNPSTTHWAGAPAREIVEASRRQVAGLLGADPSEIVFTSGGSEANNLAIKGAFFSRSGAGRHVITTAIEHPATLEPCAFLERHCDARVTVLPVNRGGLVDPDDVRRAVSADTVLISVMLANNEVGTVQPIAAIAKIASEHQVLLHVDAAQAVGKIPVRVADLGCDLLSVAGHKFYAPKGVGALYVRAGVDIEPLIHGAGHESGRRAGTESALLTAALGAASELAGDLSHVPRIAALRDHLWLGLKEKFADRVVLNGDPDARLPNTLNVSFVGLIGAEILERLPAVAASTGSACHEGRVELSPVLAAMGVPAEVGGGTIRFSLGRSTTREEIDTVLQQIIALRLYD